ncbi:MAG: hypothetical protein CME16_04640 [Gemmatimonadetes bacterium]|nr:hypothetical protein [Gemmatimonadota bacterium]
MRSRRFWSLVLVAGFLCFQYLPVVAAEKYTLRFSKSSSRMSWSPTFPGWRYSVPVQFSAAGDTTSKLKLSLSASMGYTLDQREGENIWRDNAAISSSVNYPILGPRASIGVRGSMSTSNAALQRQKIRRKSYGFSFQFKPIEDGIFKSMSASLTPGLISAQRASRAKLDSTIEEKGIQYSASLNVSPAFEIGDKKLNTSFSLRKQDNTLKNNKNRNESLRLSWNYTLPFDVRTSLSLSESRSQRGVTRSVITEEESGEDVFRDTTVAAEISESRQTNVSSSAKFKVGIYDVNSSVSYSANRNTNTANAAEDLRNTYFGRDRKSANWSFKTGVSGKLFDWLVGSAGYEYKKRNENRLPVELASGRIFRDSSADREDRDLLFKGSLDWELGEEKKLNLSGQMRSIGDDNPSAPEQDRDTFTSSSSLRYSSTLKSGLRLNISLSTSFSHRVSLHAARSSNNSRNRDIMLAFKTSYERLGASISHNFGISARRTIYDFDRIVNRSELQRKSTINRGWNMSHSINRRVLEKLRFNGRYAYSADDKGKLIVESGGQLVEEDNSDHSFSFGMSYTPFKVLSTNIGYKYRLDRKWGHEYLNLEELLKLKSRNEHQNMNMSISYNPSTVTSLSMSGSRSRQRSGTFNSFSVTFSRTI